MKVNHVCYSYELRDPYMRCTAAIVGRNRMNRLGRESEPKNVDNAKIRWEERENELPSERMNE